jgi:ABC-type oligopeptide transport system ATPase subunit
MLERVGLNEAFARRLPGELSGGQRQRASIARALITAPRFVVFDEAVSALDVSIQAQILNMVKELQGEMKFASLFISHDLAAVRYVAHNIIVMNSGEIVDRAPAKSFYAPMSNPYVRKLQEASGLVA